MQQISLFDIIAESSLAERKGHGKQSLTALVAGDQVEVYTRDARLLWSGHYVTRGRWEPASGAPEWFYFQADDGSIRELADTTDAVIWAHVGHDAHYAPPDPANVQTELIQQLRAVPLPQRIETYQAFAKQYPTASAAFGPVMRDAWDAALVASTPLTDLMTHATANRKSANFPTHVAQVIRETLWALPPNERRAAVMKLSWPDKLCTGWRTGFVTRLVTYYRPLLEYGLLHAARPEELVAVLRWWSTTTVDLIDAKGQRWVRQDDGQMACVSETKQAPSEKADARSASMAIAS